MENDMELFASGFLVGVVVCGLLIAVIHKYITNPAQLKAQVAAAAADVKKL
jgi:hypothetical protein